MTSIKHNRTAVAMRHAILTGLVLLITGCASLPDAHTQKIRHQKVEYAARAGSAPTIVLETGMGPTMSTWSDLYELLTSRGAVFAYNRPGYGRSSGSISTPSARGVAEHLHGVLEATGNKSPYILVGHSLGGLYMNMFARIYPDEVAGVVFIDSSHPEQFDYIKREMPIAYGLLAASSSSPLNPKNYEFKIIENARDEFRNAPPFPDVPLEVLTASHSSIFETEASRRQWLKFQIDLSMMSSLGRQRIVQDSGHFIHSDQPEFVVEVILNMR